MSFHIGFVNRSCTIAHVTDEPRLAAKGEILLGDYREDFYSTLDVWTCSRFEDQWQDALERLRRGENSCFVVGVHPPLIARFIECWIFWRVKNEYRVQNQCMFFDKVGVVDPADPYDAIWPYTTQTVDGDRLADWGLPVDLFT